MIRARLKIPVKTREIAVSLNQAVGPDNKMPGLEIIGRPASRSITFDVKFDGRVETFIFTLDDVLRCLQAAMETLDKI